MTPPVILFNGTPYRVAETIESGMTASVYRTEDGKVIKQYRPGQSLCLLDRDVFWLEQLKDSGIVPELMDMDRSNLAILMSDCGEPLSAQNAPHDWEAQLTSLLEKLRANRCFHNDISERNVLVKDSKLRVIDFAYAVEADNNAMLSDRFPDGAEKVRYFLDEHLVDYIRFHLFGPPSGAEPHCFVLWKADEHIKVHLELSKKFEIVRAIAYTPRLFEEWFGDPKAILDKFYCGRPSAHGDKGRTPFILYFVIDREPRYEMRTNPLRSSQDVVNVNVFDLKTRLRKGRTGYLHGSDTVQESFDNLEALTMYGGQGVPKAFWLRWRPRFASVNEFFEHLNTVADLDYVVLRNFGGLAENRADESSDIDILVNDFFLFKRVSGAIGYKHKRVKRPSPAHEYGGYKVAGYVLIGGQDITVDIRFAGDSYYCEQWQQNILERRVRHANFYIPDAANLFYSLLYHALVHKRSVSDQYRELLSELASGVELEGQLAASDRQLWVWLDAFMKNKGYEYVRPNELSIPLSSKARVRIGINNAEDLCTAEKSLSKGKLGKAMDLLIGVLSEDPDNKIAQRFLLTAERSTKELSGLEQFVRSIRMTRVGRLLPASIKRPIKRLLLSSR